MKKIFASMLFTTVLFTVSTFAQNGSRVERIKHYLVDSLGVPDVKADSVMAISQRTIMQARAIMKDQSLSQDEKREKIKPLKEDAKSEMKKYLTEEQVEKLEQKQMQWRQNREGGGVGNGRKK